MDVGQTRQSGRVDLDHGADHDELPFGLRPGDGFEQRHVEAFIDDAEEAEAGTRQVGLIGGFGALAGPCRSGCASTLLGKQWTFGWRSFFAGIGWGRP